MMGPLQNFDILRNYITLKYLIIFCTYYKTLIKANYHEEKVIAAIFIKSKAIYEK